MSITEKILKLLITPTTRYKGIPVNCFGLPLFSAYNKQSVRNSFSKLQSKNFITRDGSYFSITKDGKNYLKRKESYLQTFESPFGKKVDKNLLVLFDVIENRKIEREWLRRHLRKFGYNMIQKSVWVGPSPLPKEFISYVKKIKLDDSIKTFKLAKGYTHSKR